VYFTEVDYLKKYDFILITLYPFSFTFLMSGQFLMDVKTFGRSPREAKTMTPSHSAMA
jgi:hypothetical protein